jgi:hypothetical protein
MKKLLKVARKRAGLKLFDVKGGVAQLRHVPGDCLVQKVLGPEEMLEDGQYISLYPYISGEWPDDDCQLLEG